MTKIHYMSPHFFMLLFSMCSEFCNVFETTTSVFLFLKMDVVILEHEKKITTVRWKTIFFSI